MNKTFILLLLLISQIKGRVLETPLRTNFHSISDINQMDIEKLDCSLELIQISQQLKAWQTIFLNEKELDTDIQSLKSIQASVKDFRQLHDHRQIFTQINTSFLTNMRDVGVFDESPYQQWRKEGIDGLQGYLNLLDQASSIDESQACCDRIQKLIEKLLNERENIKTECQQPQIKINIIDGKANQVQKKQQACQAQGVQLDGFEDNDKTKHNKIPVKSEYASNSKHEQQLKPTDKKPKLSDDSAIIKNRSAKEEPLMDRLRNVQQHLQEYGYGFWFRFLTIYPERLPNGKNLPLYFVSGLIQKEPYENIKMGHRTLAIWQGQLFYTFQTYTVESNFNYPPDIEGVWTYIYYSYSVEHQKAVGFIKFGDSDFQTVVQPVTHPNTNQLRFLAGNDEKRYPKFNGLFTRVIFNDQLGAYISQLQILQQLIASQGPAPSVSVQDLISQELVQGVAERYPTDDIKVIQVTDARLPHEYAISGWFKFVQPSDQANWHSAFRVQVTTPGKDWTLGDRVLMYELGKSGDIWTSTYTYQDMYGAGTANLPTYIPHQNRPYQWHFVYQGYSKALSLAYFIAKFTNSQESFLWTNTKHYYPNQFHVLLGSTFFLQGWNGYHAFVSFHTGKGAFKIQINSCCQFYSQPRLQKSPSTTYPAFLESKSSQEEPLMDKQMNVQQPYQEYGCGFWFRFLTIYPERLPIGKNQLWYFVSQLEDRRLAIWQGQLFYTFQTYTVESNFNYPPDIEGVWTYIYYSYSVEHQKAVGFIKFGDSDFQTVVQLVTHPNTNQLRFILAGNDFKRYPGFNGLFTRVIFNDQLGAYISQLQILQQLIASQGSAPSVSVQELISLELVQGVAERIPTDDIKVIQVNDARLPHEYAISGWFKFVKPSNQADWHSAFRVQVTTPGKDGTLGDRVLMYELGINDIWSSTYTYSNMNGAGTANQPKTASHQQRPYQWHFVYQGYSKALSLAYFIAKFTYSQESFQWTEIKHYYPGQFHVLLGSTFFLQGWSGQHAFVSFHTGEGAFKVGNDYGDPQDRFKQIAASNSILIPLSTIQKQKKCSSSLMIDCSQL